MIPSIVPLGGVECRVKSHDRRAFRREIVLRVLPALLGMKRTDLPKRRTVAEFAFDIANACVLADEQFAKEGQEPRACDAG